MKLVDWEDFCEMPDGTVFSIYESNGYPTEGLAVRRQVIHNDQGGAIDFFFTSLVPEARPIEPPDDIGLAVELDFTPGRWGVYDYDQLFAIYESDDLAGMIACLNPARTP